MRIARLDLLRYGKFTDKSVALPIADKDFHLIVGPNEAGKSTIRNAIQELLFGIENRSSYNFLHPHSDMRLGALIEHDGDKLDFIRTKARTKTLQTFAGIALPDNALSPFLGQLDRDFFDQMFGLNYDRLVEGGQEILSASNDVGQILFQAAAGIASLGDVRDKLEAEADKLWSKRKSNEREYYIASNELEQADDALKQATVRTKDWLEASTKVDQIGDGLKQAREQYRAMEQERIQLERVRRVAPMLTTLAEFELQLTELGEVILLPENASSQLASAENEITIATQSFKYFENQVSELQEKIKRLQPNAAVLGREADIQALSEMRLQLRNHETDIGKREEEIRVLWQSVEDSMRQLGWPMETEDAVAQRLPGSLVRSEIDNLIRRYESVAQSLTTAEESLRSKDDDVKSIALEIASLPAIVIPLTLNGALVTARSLGDIEVKQSQIEAQIAKLTRELEYASIELGEWNTGTSNLRKLLPPTQDEMNALIKQRNDLALAASTSKERLDELCVDIKSLELEISQYKNKHHPVTLADVQGLRISRDLTWQSIKAGDVVLKDAAIGFEKEVAESDSLSDKRHDKATEETELQSRLDQLQKLQLQKESFESRLQTNLLSLNNFDQRWDNHTKNIGLPGMPLLQVNGWRYVRERILTATDTLLEAQSSQVALNESVALAKATLVESLIAIKPESSSLNLPALILLAEDIVTTANSTQVRRDTLTTQKGRTKAAITDLENRVSQAKVAIDAWRADLQKNLTIAHLPSDANIGTIEAALILFESMSHQLQKIRDIRSTRIDMMQRDLTNFKVTAKSLATDIAPEIAKETADQIALLLANILTSELTTSQELNRLKAELDKSIDQSRAESNKIVKAQASIEPLLHLSGASDNDSLHAAIEKSDRLRTLTTAINQNSQQLLHSGDGLDRTSLQSEFETIEVSMITVRLSEIKFETDAVVNKQNQLSGELSSAETVLGEIAGQDEAARAESQRQEALARMSNAAERYIKVYTASKLLRWSIERFRESKQGPMLVRAGSIFEGLTIGGFNRLVVDYESEPFKLSGQRATGGLVSIDGMSEGTRDQLFLALRLAALELHLEQSVPLPFIADDLFINYDDGRAKAGLEALANLAEKTQVIFLSHHEHLVPVAQTVFGDRLNVIDLSK